MTRMVRFGGTLVLGVVGLTFNAMGQAPVRTWVSGAGLDGNPCSRQEPCRTFGAAITAVASRGEVVVLDSAGFGPVLINKPVPLISPPGVHAAIAPTAGVGITVDVGAFDVVVIRGIYVNSQGAEDGILHMGAGVLQVESCVISGFPREGIEVDGDDSGVIRLFVLDSVLRNIGQGFFTSIYVLRGSALIDRCRIENAGTGVFADDGAVVTVRETVVATGDKAFWSRASTDMISTYLTVDRCLATGSTFGVFASGSNVATQGRVTVINSTMAVNSVGIGTAAHGIVSVTGSTLSENGAHLNIAASAAIVSYGNNTLYPSSGNFTQTILLK